MIRQLLALLVLVGVLPISAQAASVQNTVVFEDPALFAGWPANEGFWQWGDEMLVGFNVTKYLESSTTHNVDPNAYQWVNFARSLDGGETWTIEQHPEVSIPGLFNGPNYLKNPSYPAIPAPVASPGGFNFTDPGFALKARGDKFWVSTDKGHNWSVPYELPDFGLPYLQARTNYLVLDSQTMLLFYEGTFYPPSSGEYTNTLVVKTSDGGQTFQQLSLLTDDPLQGHDTSWLPAYSVMPGVTQLDDGTMLAVARNRLSSHSWNDLRSSTDGGNTWQTISTPVDGNNNPASLVSLGGRRLALVYGYRNAAYGLRGKISEDGGQTWSKEYVLRDDGREWDLGYVRAGLRSDGKVTAVYYYTTDDHPANFIASTIWDVPASASSSLRAHYKFDETAGPTLFDIAGNANGTTHNVTFSAGGALASSGGSGIFDGSTSSVDFGSGSHPSEFDLGTGNFTIAGWFKSPTNNETGVFGNRPLFQCIDYSQGGWVFEMGRADRSYRGKVFFTVGGGDSGVFGQTQTFSNVRLDDNQWHWVAVVNEGGELRMYVDGVLQTDTGTMQSISTATAPGSVEAQFGARGTSQAPFAGQLDDWRIYDEALTVALDGNSLIGGDLYNVWQNIATVILHPGDANGDGQVNLSDLQILGDNWMSTTADWSTGDFTGDGQVNLADLQVLGDNWGYSVLDITLDEALQAAGISVPEPTSLLALTCAAASLLTGRRRQQNCF